MRGHKPLLLAILRPNSLYGCVRVLCLHSTLWYQISGFCPSGLSFCFLVEIFSFFALQPDCVAYKLLKGEVLVVCELDLAVLDADLWKS